MDSNKKKYELETIKLEIKTDKKNIIKIENDDDINDDNNDVTCGGREELENLDLKPKKPKNKKICNKCKTNKSQYYVRTEFICKPCFFNNLNHKFRSNLRVNCKIRHEDTVLVCVSGGNNSMALTNWFNITFNDNTSNKKLFFKLKFLYVDNTFLKEEFLNFTQEKYDLLTEQRKNKQIFFAELFKKFNFEYEIINLENIINIPRFNLIISPENEEKSENFLVEKEKLKKTNFDLIEKYLKIYNNITKSGSFENDFNKILTKNLILFYSKISGYNKIIFGNNGQSLVANIFTSIIKGRGFTTREEISYVDSRYFNGNPLILRPLKDFLDKEILLFNYMHGIEALQDTLEIDFVRFNQKNSTPFKGNTNNLVESFFDNLQNRMPSTITSVLGSADKLKEQKDNKELKNNFKTCEFCLSYIDEVYNILEIGSLDSVNNDCIFHKDNLCFGCKRLFQNISSGDKDNSIIEHQVFYKN